MGFDTEDDELLNDICAKTCAFGYFPSSSYVDVCFRLVRFDL